MELLLSFLAGLALASLVAFLLYRSRLNTERYHTEKRVQDLHDMFEQTVSNVSAQVRNETSEMLRSTQREFSDYSQESIGRVLTPLRENIAQLRDAMEKGSREQAELSGQMRERLTSLMEHSDAARKSAEELAAAFKHSGKVQGDWGEAVLDELLSSHGLTKGIHYDIQASICDPDGRAVRGPGGGPLRPDVIVHLDQRRELIIDSKVSLTAYVDYVNAENEADRQKFLRFHVESIRRHVKELAAKDYSSHVRPPKVSAGYVIMFVPNVGALWTALNAEPDLWRMAAADNVYIADEQSLYGALKIVSLTWTQIAQEQNHEMVYALANEMIDRVGQFMEHYESVGKALRKASDEYDEGMRKLDVRGRSIVNTSAKLVKLGARNSEQHPVKSLIDIDSIQVQPVDADKTSQEDSDS